MTTPSIRYKAGYKYQLVANYEVNVALHVGWPKLVNKFIRLTPEGKLTIKAGYAWDGASGPGIDTLSIMRGSLVHDALYQLMHEGLLPQSYRKEADLELRRICREDGMSALRAWWVYQGVRFGGGPSADPYQDRVPIEAP